MGQRAAMARASWSDRNRCGAGVRRPQGAGTKRVMSDLANDLRRAVAGEVRFDAGSRALYATDASNYRQVPIGVVIPRDADDVTATIDVCRRHGAPLLSRGG